MNNSLYIKFKALYNKEQIKGAYRVDTILEGLPHMIGCSKEGYPIIFISTSDSTKTSDIKLELITVLFNRDCNIKSLDSETEVRKKFSVLQLNSKDYDLQRYFLEVINLVLLRINGVPTTAILKNELGKMISLFMEPKSLSMDTIRGLWGELFVIEQSNDPDYLIKSWHVTTTEKYDFNDGVCKLEIKSTGGVERKHIFSLEQLSPEEGAILFIGSIFVNQTGIGKSIFNLVDEIEGRGISSGSSLKLKEQVLNTIGAHINEAEDIFFDYNRAVSSYKLFDHVNIPKISMDSIPHDVSKVSFQSNLENITSVKKDALLHLPTLFSKLLR